MKVSILGSGSSGNSIFIEANKEKFLIDAGFSGKKIVEKLISIGEKIEDIKGILITHEHGDHILGAGIISRKYNIPLYITRESYQAGEKRIGKIDKGNLNFIEGNFNLGSVLVTPFDVMHDAARTLGFSIKWNGKKIVVATDIGNITNIVRAEFQGANIAIIECNYDYNMLMDAPYPWDLKNRIKGRRGHLSNIDSGHFIADLYHENLKKVYLAHVSKDANCYDLAYETVRDILDKKNITLDVEIIKQGTTTSLYALNI